MRELEAVGLQREGDHGVVVLGLVRVDRLAALAEVAGVRSIRPARDGTSRAPRP
jgi:hypothetical protein